MYSSNNMRSALFFVYQYQFSRSYPVFLLNLCALGLSPAGMCPFRDTFRLVTHEMKADSHKNIKTSSSDRKLFVDIKKECGHYVLKNNFFMSMRCKAFRCVVDPSERGTFNQCWFNVGLTLKTMDQH